MVNVPARHSLCSVRDSSDPFTDHL